MNRKGSALLIVLLVIAAVLIFGFIWYRQTMQSSSPTTQASSTPQNTSAGTASLPASSASTTTSNWQIYTNHEDNYQIKYPAKWFNLGDNTGPQFSDSESYASTSSYFSIYRLASNQAGPANPSLLSIQQWFKQEYPSALSAAVQITGDITTSVSSTKVISIGGRQAVELAFINPNSYEQEIVDYIANNTDVYGISYQDFSPQKYTAIYQAMLSTFQFFIPTSTISASSITPTSSGNLYTNTQYNFQTVFPKGYTVYDGKYLEGATTYFGEYPKQDSNGNSSGTKIVAASLGARVGETDFSVWKDTSPSVVQSCGQADVNEENLGLILVASSSESINGLRFWPYEYEDAGMSKSQVIVGYSTLHDNACYSVEVLVIQSPDGSGKTIDTAAAVSALQKMLPTFKFLQ